jgi:anti-sigma B factor antagonist
MSQLADLDIEEREGAVVATISGEIDLSNAATLERAMLDAVPNTASGIVVDLSAVSYLDSAGIRMLGEMAERLRWREQRLAVVAPEGSRVRGVITMAGARDVVGLEETADAARRRVAHDR